MDKKLIIVVFSLFGLLMVSLYMHSPLRIKPTDLNFVKYHENKKSFSRDKISYPKAWVDNPYLLRQNFARTTIFMKKNFPEYWKEIIYVIVSSIFFISIYLTGYELFRDKLYALVPCFIYYFGFEMPLMQNQYHDNELNANHLSMAMVALSFYFYLKDKKITAYAFSALLFYVRIRTAYTWGLVLLALLIIDFYKERDFYSIVIKRSILPVIISIPAILMTLPTYKRYDFSWLPEWAQYSAFHAGPGGRSLFHMLENFMEWNEIIGLVFMILSCFLLLKYYRKRNDHIESLKIAFVVSLAGGVITGLLWDIWHIEAVGKLYLLAFFSYPSLIQFYLLSFLFIEAFKKRDEFENMFICFFGLLLIPFYGDAFIQFSLTLLILLRFKGVKHYFENRGINIYYVISGISAGLLIYFMFIKEPRHAARWVEAIALISILIFPYILSGFLRKREQFKGYVLITFLAMVSGLALASSANSHKGVIADYEERFPPAAIEVCRYLDEHADINAIVIGPPKGINWSDYSNRMTIVYHLHTYKLAFDSKNMFPELIKRSTILFEKGALEKYSKLRWQGKKSEANNYVNGFWKNLDKLKLYKIKKRYNNDIEFVIREKELPLKGLEEVFKNKTYIVYRIS